MTRLFFITDVHASDKCFRKFLNAAKAYKVNNLILGGDITGKVMVPIVDMGDGTYSVNLFGTDTVIKGEKLEDTKKSLLNAGQYYFVTNPKELEELNANKEKADQVFNDCILSLLRSWLALAEERLRGTDVKCYISPGNDDRLEVDSVLKDSEHVVNPENRLVELDGGHEMITLGVSNPTPWKSPREVSEEKFGEMIEALASQVKRPETAIFGLHVPPFNTELDKAPAVTEDFRYVRDGLSMKVIHIGSSAVRSAIEKYQPLLGLHGHVHEARGFVKIGRTLCLNPGSEYADGVLRGALVNLDGGKVKEYLLTSG
jgi:Icc-related predicted phosphoesterase